MVMACPGGIIEMTSAACGDGQHLGHRDGVRLGQPAQAVRLGRERGRRLSRDRPCGTALRADRGHLGERALAAGQRDHEVLVAVLGADDARLADGQAGLPGDLARSGARRR